MLRYMTMEVRAFQTSNTGMTVIHVYVHVAQQLGGFRRADECGLAGRLCADGVSPGTVSDVRVNLPVVSSTFSVTPPPRGRWLELPLEVGEISCRPSPAAA